MRHRTIPLVLVLCAVTVLVALSPAPAEAADRFVATAGNDSSGANTCTNSATPCKTIGQAIGQAASGDTIKVAGGVYSENLSLIPASTFELTLLGGFDTGFTNRAPKVNVTIIDGGGFSPVFSVASFTSGAVVTATLDGFTIRNGFNSFGGGGGITTQSSSGSSLVLNLTNNVIAGNKGSLGGGIVIRGNSTIVKSANNILIGNSSSTAYAIGVIESTIGGTITLSMTNDTITGNTHLGSSVGNGALLFSVGAAGPLVTATLTNVVILGNTPTDISVNSSGVTVNASFSDIGVVNTSGGTYSCTPGCINADPQFVNAVAGNVHLKAGSPAIDAGTNSAPNLPATDADGFPRIFPPGGRVNMGAFESGMPQTAATTKAKSLGTQFTQAVFGGPGFYGDTLSILSLSATAPFIPDPTGTVLLSSYAIQTIVLAGDLALRVTLADPFDPDFATVMSSPSFSIPPVTPSNPVFQGVADRANAAIADLLAVYSDLRVIQITLNRYSSAVSMGDAASSARQSDALSGFLDLLRADSARASASMLAYRTSLMQNGQPNPSIGFSELSSFQDQVRATGFPTNEIDLFVTLGLTASEIAQVRDNVLLVDVATVPPTDLFSLLSSTGTILSDVSAAARPASIPTLSEWAQIGMAALLLGGGLLALRKKGQVV